MPISTDKFCQFLGSSFRRVSPDAIIFGKSEAMQSLRARMDKVASANVPVLIHGESGTGKDIIARMIHGFSPWRGGPFVKVNCPAIPGTLLESELFGYEKGAFTGAYGTQSRAGWKWRIAAPFSWTKFLSLIWPCSPSYCSFCRTASSAASAPRKTRKSKSASCAPPTANWKRNREWHVPAGFVLSH